MTTHKDNVTSSGEMKNASDCSVKINSNENVAKEGEEQICGLLSNKGDTVEERQYPREPMTSSAILEPIIPPSESVNPESESTKLTQMPRSQWFTITILCYINLVRCMDQFNLAGNMKFIFKLHFRISQVLINLSESPTCVKP